MENIIVTETRIGTTTYTVERVFSKEAKEDALQAIKRLLLQKARSEGQGRGMACSNIERGLSQSYGKESIDYSKY